MNFGDLKIPHKLLAVFAVMLSAIAIMGVARGPAIMLLVGAAIFSVTLYAMALGAPKWLGAVTPIGGTLLIAAWLWAGWLYWRG